MNEASESCYPHQRLLVIDIDSLLASIRYYRWSGIIGLICGVAAFGFAGFNFILAGDDWHIVINNISLIKKFNIANGRWFSYLLQKLLYLDEYNAITIWTFFAISVNILCGILICHILHIRSRIAGFLVICLYTLIPFWIEPFAFYISMVSIPVGNLLVLASIIIITDTNDKSYCNLHEIPSIEVGMRILLSSILIMLSIALYQVTAVLYIVMLISYMVVTIVNNNFKYDKRQIVKKTWYGCVSLGLGICLYGVSVAASRAILKVGEFASGRYSLTGDFITGYNQLLNAFVIFCKTVFLQLLGPTHHFPQRLKVIFFLLFCFIIFKLIVNLIQKRAKLIDAGLILVGTLSTFLIPFLWILFKRNGMPRYSMLIPLGISYGLVFVLAWLFTTNRFERVVCFCMTIVIVFFFCVEDNSALVGHYNLTEKEKFITADILHRIYNHKLSQQQSLPDRLLIIGRLEYRGKYFGIDSIQGCPLSDSILESGVYNSQRGHFRAIKEIVFNGSRIRPVFENEYPALAKRFKETHNVWPAEDSVDIVDGIAVVLLGSIP